MTLRPSRVALAWGIVAMAVTGRAVALDAEMPVGVRSIGMGQTGVTLPGRASVVSRNVGAIASLESYASEAFAANVFGLIRANYVAGVLPFSERRALGFDWLRLQAEDSELGYSENRLRLAYSLRPHRRVGVGMGLNYRTQSASLDASDLGGAAGWSTDLGAIWTPPRFDGLSLGVSARNWLSSVAGGAWRSGAWVRLEEGPSQRVAPRVWSWGMSYQRDRLVALLEWSEGLHVGVERSVGGLLAVRGGAVLPSQERAGVSYSLGASLKWRWGTLDYALDLPSGLEPTSYFGLSFGADYRVPPVIIEHVSMAELYVSLRDYYARPQSPRLMPAERGGGDAPPSSTGQRLGEVQLYNPGDVPVRVSIRLWIERFTSSRGTEVVEGVEVGPRERRAVGMQKLLLSDRALALDTSRGVECSIEVTDVRNPSRRRALATTTTTLHGRNEMRLDDLGKLAVFVTPTDRSIRDSASAIVRLAEGDELAARLPRNLRSAMALFAGLRGIAYGSDPNLPRERGTIDAVRFPSELLARLRDSATDTNRPPVGDCDDSAVLVCALFEAVGIPTALIQTPKHVLIAFDVGELSMERAQDAALDDVAIAIDGNAWIPLETTLLSRGFAEAWREGLRQVHNGIVDSVTTRAAWELYGSVVPELPDVSFTVASDVLMRRMRQDVRNPWLRSRLDAFEALGTGDTR